MGTKVQCKSYSPGYYPMRNLNEASSSSWSRFYEDKTSSGHFSNDFMLKPVNGYLGYDKEMLKRTMIEHEAIFRKQVYELHRLYRTQKDLMDELKMKELYKASIQMDTSHCLFSSRMPSETTEKIWQMPRLTAVNTSYNRADVAGSDDLKPPLDLLKENSGQSSQIPTKNGISLKDGELWDSKLTGHPRRTFDLQLPADFYIDSEDSERTEIENIAKSPFRDTDPLGIIGGVECGNDVKLTLGTSEDTSCSKGGWKLDLHRQNGRTIHRLADLNEPVKSLEYEVEKGSVSTHFLGVRTHHEQIQGHQLPVGSNKSTPPRDFFTDKHRDEGICSNFVDADKGKAGWEGPSFNNGKSRKDVKNSLNPSLCSEKFPIFSEPTQLKLKRAHEILSPDYNKTQTWLGEKPIDGVETSLRSSQVADSDHSGPASPQVPGPFSVVPRSDYSSSASPLVSSWRKPTHGITHVPIAVQALPCFKGSGMMNSQSRKSKASTQNPTNSCDKLQYNGNLWSRLTLGTESSSYSNGFHHDIRSDSNFSTQLKNNSDSSIYGNSEGNGPQKCSILNQALPNGIQDDITAKRDIEGKHEESSGGVSWLGTEPTRNDSRMELAVSQQGYSQQKSTSDTMAPEIKKKLQDFPLSLQVKESRIQRNEAPFSLKIKKNPGFPIIDKLQQTAICSPSTDDVNSSGKNIILNVGSHSLGFQNHINSNSADISPEDEAEFPSPLSVPSMTGKIAPKFDLEAPILSHEEIKGTNHLLIPTKISSGKRDCRQETERPHETLDRLAAENLVTLSLDICPLLAPASCYSLHWFAEVVSSKAASVETSGDDNDELDLFESMTLKLEEVKPDEYWCMPWEQENPKEVEDDRCTASLLLTRPRRGQARKRRQRRDFQKDILPGLASLSRHEMTEDLQAFGELMRVTGKAWQAGLTRRSTGRKGPNCQARGRRQPRSLAFAVAEVRAGSTPTQTMACAELEIDGRSIMGWGRTTRRCRRQRVTSGNASSFPQT